VLNKSRFAVPADVFGGILACSLEHRLGDWRLSVVVGISKGDIDKWAIRCDECCQAEAGWIKALALPCFVTTVAVVAARSAMFIIVFHAGKRVLDFRRVVLGERGSRTLGRRQIADEVEARRTGRVDDLEV